MHAAKKTKQSDLELQSEYACAWPTIGSIGSYIGIFGGGRANAGEAVCRCEGKDACR